MGHRYPPATFRVEGLLRHRFWGDYSAAVALLVDTEPALAMLRVHVQGVVEQLTAHGCKAAVEFASKGPSHGACIVTDSEGVAIIEAWAEPFRTDACCRFDRRQSCYGRKRHGIASLAHSIDYGPAFDLALETVDTLTPALPGFPRPAGAPEGGSR